MSLVVLSGLDDAILGLGQRFGPEGHKAFLIYDVNKILDTFMNRDGMDEEEAVEFFQYNIQGAFLGEATPAFMTPMDSDSLHRNIDEIMEIIEAEGG